MAAPNAVAFGRSISAPQRQARASGLDAWPLWRALVVGLLFIEIATLLGGVAAMLGVQRVQGAAAAVLMIAGHGFGGEIAGPDLTWIGLAAALAVAPLVGILILAVSAAAAHLPLIILAPRHAGFGATFRVVSMASVIHLVNWIPIIGLPLNVFGMFLVVLGLKRVHPIGLFRAILVGFAPAIAVLVYAAVILFAPE